MYPATGETAVPDLSQLRAELEAVTAAGDWLRVAELAAQLAVRSKG